MTESEILTQLKNDLDENRYLHTLGVAFTATSMAMKYGVDIQKAYIAGLLHDCAKCIPKDKQIQMCKENNIYLDEGELNAPQLIHSKLGAFLAKSKYGIQDEEILSAIEKHTTGDADMTPLEMIIFTADYIEPHRDKAVNLAQVRSLAFTDLKAATFKILSDTIDYLKSKKSDIYYKTFDAYEYLNLNNNKEVNP